MLTRRGLIKKVALAGAGSLIPWQLRAARNPDHRLLILVELNGGNDGLNTVVPFAQDRYHRELRPNIGIEKKNLVALDDEVGLNASMHSLTPLWNAGELAVVQGLGYPAPNRSHFTSLHHLHTGGDGNNGRATGWVASALNSWDGSPFELSGASLNGGLGPFERGMGIYIDLHKPELLFEIDQPDADQTNPGRTAPGRGVSTNPALATLLRRRSAQQEATRIIRERLTNSANARPSNAFPHGELGRQCALLWRLLAAGLDVGVVKVQLTGFDTHAYQRGEHDGLLNNLAENLAALRAGLMELDRWNRTIVMTYSEFGRRAQENASQGTDHGAAAPHFVTGGDVAGGLFGEAPDLDALVEGDVPTQIDYRALYHASLSGAFSDQGQSLANWRDPRLDGLFS